MFFGALLPVCRTDSHPPCSRENYLGFELFIYWFIFMYLHIYLFSSLKLHKSTKVWKTCWIQKKSILLLRSSLYPHAKRPSFFVQHLCVSGRGESWGIHRLIPDRASVPVACSTSLQQSIWACECKCSNAMAGRISSVSATYQQQLADITPFILTMPYGWTVCGHFGVAILFSNKEAGVQFLKDVGPLLVKVACNACGCRMSWCIDSKRMDGFRWRCCRRTYSSVCSISTSVRHDSWFRHSNLTLMEVKILTYLLIYSCILQIHKRETCWIQNKS